MAIRLNKEAFEHAKELIEGGLEVNHELGNWQEAAPTRDEEAKFAETHYLDEYGLWFLGINTDKEEEDSLDKFSYPTGDLNIIYKSALVKAHEDAEKNKHPEIAEAAKKLIALIDRKK